MTAVLSPRIGYASRLPDAAPVRAEVVLRLGQLAVAGEGGRHGFEWMVCRGEAKGGGGRREEEQEWCAAAKTPHTATQALREQSYSRRDCVTAACGEAIRAPLTRLRGCLAGDAKVVPAVGTSFLSPISVPGSRAGEPHHSSQAGISVLARRGAGWDAAQSDVARSRCLIRSSLLFAAEDDAQPPATFSACILLVDTSC